MLLKNDVDLNAVENVDGNTGLMLAVRENNEDVVKYLVNNTKANVNISNKFGYTALMIAASNGNLKILDVLLQHPNIDLDKVNKAGKRAEECGRRRQNDNVRAVIFAARKRKLDSSDADEPPPAKKPNTSIDIKTEDAQNFKQKSLGVVDSVVGFFEDETNIVKDGSGDLNPVDPEAVSDELKNILSARLENCLIELGSQKLNIKLCGEIYKIAVRMELSELVSICKKTLLENLCKDTVFHILEFLGDDPDSRQICINYLRFNFDHLKQIKDWKIHLQKYPDIALELLDHV